MGKKRKKLASLRRPLQSNKKKSKKTSVHHVSTTAPLTSHPTPPVPLTITTVIHEIEQQQRHRIPSYLPQSLARSIAKRVGGKCKVKHVNNFVVALRQKRRRKQGKKKPAFYYFILNKPVGYTSMRDNPNTTIAQYPSCYDVLPKEYPAVPHVGRLDVETEGLLMFTDDGQLLEGLINDRDSTKAIAYTSKYCKKRKKKNKKRNHNDQLEQQTVHVREKVAKVYLVQVSIGDASSTSAVGFEEATASSLDQGRLDTFFLENMKQKLVYPDGTETRPAEVNEATSDVENNATLRRVVRKGGGASSSSSSSSSSMFWLCVKITQGKNRQVRRLCARAGIDVHRLIRFSLGPLSLSSIVKPGSIRSLTHEELVACYGIACPNVAIKHIPEMLDICAT
jgi:16S rRNA U516 pseudouridylate synthase RsuA-like enzyme